MEEYLKIITNNQKKNDPKVKSAWYFVEKALMKEEKPKLHKEMKVGAKRVYQLYKNATTWDGPSPRQLRNMRKAEFDRLMGRDDTKKGILWKEATPKERQEEVLPPFLLDWEDADLGPDQSMSNLEDLMQGAENMEDQQSLGPTVVQSQPQYDEAQQWIASMFDDLGDHVTIEELAN